MYKTKDKQYHLHQTPSKLAKVLIEKIPLEEGDRVLEPFKGEGSFYNNLPTFTINDWCEITEGRDYRENNNEVDWIITNPPFKLQDSKGKLKNMFYNLVLYYSTRVNKGISFLGSAYCFNSIMNGGRMKELNNNRLYLTKIISCRIKKWFGVYYMMIFMKQDKNILLDNPTNSFEVIEGNWE